MRKSAKIWIRACTSSPFRCRKKFSKIQNNQTIDRRRVSSLSMVRKVRKSFIIHHSPIAAARRASSAFLFCWLFASRLRGFRFLFWNIYHERGAVYFCKLITVFWLMLNWDYTSVDVLHFCPFLVNFSLKNTWINECSKKVLICAECARDLLWTGVVLHSSCALY